MVSSLKIYLLIMNIHSLVLFLVLKLHAFFFLEDSYSLCILLVFMCILISGRKKSKQVRGILVSCL